MIWSNPYADEDDSWTMQQIITFPFVLLIIPILFVIDVITFPFHLINVIGKRCFGVNPSVNYWYEYMLCGWAEKSSPQADTNHYRYEVLGE